MQEQEEEFLNGVLEDIQKKLKIGGEVITLSLRHHSAESSEKALKIQETVKMTHTSFLELKNDYK